MTDEQRRERDDWETLTATEGWKRLMAYVEANFIGPDLVLKQIANRPEKAEVLIGIAKGIRAALEYPQGRVEALTALDKQERVPDPFKHLRRVP